jgi:hypothetical protein
MASPLALLRLAERPFTLASLFMALLMYAVLAGPRPLDATVNAVWQGSATTAQRVALWQALILLPAALGMQLGLYRLDLQHTILSWSLPALRRSLLTGAATVAVPLAAVAAWLMARNAGLALSAPAFTLTLAAFALAWFVYDTAVPAMPRALAAVGLIVAALTPAWLAQHAEARPLLTATLALLLVVPALLTTASALLARRRAFIEWAYTDSGATSFTGRTAGREREWSASLATSRLLPWLGAAIYESAVRFPRDHATHALIAVLAARVLDVPFVIVAAAVNWLMTTDVRLHQLWYPLGRRQHARLVFGTMFLHAITYFAVAAGMLAIALLLPLPRIPLMGARDPAQLREWVMVLATAFALAPFAQWARVRWPHGPRAPGGMAWANFWRMALYVVATGAWIGLIGTQVQDDVGDFLVATAALALAMQIGNWIHLQHHFTTADLVQRNA